MRAIFLDQETTGLDCTKHVVVDIAFKIVDLTTNEILASYQSLVQQPSEAWEQQDPMSLEINGYTRESGTTGKLPALIREEIIALFTQWGIIRGQAVFICQNPSFDRPFFNQLINAYVQENLNWPYHWLDLASMFWAQRMQAWLAASETIPLQMNLSKDSIASHYQIPAEATPHHALNGVNHLIQCYQAVFGIHFLAT